MSDVTIEKFEIDITKPLLPIENVIQHQNTMPLQQNVESVQQPTALVQNVASPQQPLQISRHYHYYHFVNNYDSYVYMAFFVILILLIFYCIADTKYFSNDVYTSYTPYTNYTPYEEHAQNVDESIAAKKKDIVHLQMSEPYMAEDVNAYMKDQLFW